MFDINKHIVMKDLNIASSIYIDIEFLKYIEVGRCITNPLMTQEIYSQILSVLNNESFDTRVTNDLQYLCKDINLIKELIQDNPNQHNEILVSSPSFDTAEFIVKYLVDSFNENNKRAEFKEDVKIFLDIHSVKNISNDIRVLLMLEYQDVFGCEVQLVDSISTSTLYDVYLVPDISRISVTLKNSFEENFLMEKYVISNKLLPLSRLDIVKNYSNWEQSFYYITYFYTLACRFSLIPPFQLLRE